MLFQVAAQCYFKIVDLDFAFRRWRYPYQSEVPAEFVDYMITKSLCLLCSLWTPARRLEFVYAKFLSACSD